MFLMGLFVATTAFASEPIPANRRAVKELKEVIQQKLHYPQFATESKTECSILLNIIVNISITISFYQSLTESLRFNAIKPD